MTTGVGGNYRVTQPTIAAHSVFVITNEYSVMVLLLLAVAAICIVMCMICCICCCCYCSKARKLKGGNVAPVSAPAKGGSPQKGGKAAPLKKQDSKAGAKKK